MNGSWGGPCVRPRRATTRVVPTNNAIPHHVLNVYSMHPRVLVVKTILSSSLSLDKGGEMDYHDVRTVVWRSRVESAGDVHHAACLTT